MEPTIRTGYSGSWGHWWAVCEYRVMDWPGRFDTVSRSLGGFGSEADARAWAEKQSPFVEAAGRAGAGGEDRWLTTQP